MEEKTKKKIKVRSGIAKGRAFQKVAMEAFKEAFGLTEDDIRCPVGSETGEDIKLTKKARKIIGLSIECKNQKKFNLWQALRQSSANCPDDACEAVVFKEHGRAKMFIIVPLDHYLEIREKLYWGIS